MTDSYHFQIAPEPAKEALFREGSVYLDGYGIANYVQSVTSDGRFLWVRSWGEGQWDKSKFRHLANGKFECLSDKDSQHHLLPGEVALRGDGQWVAADAPIVFPSGAAVLTSGDKIVGRVSGTFTGVVVTVGAGGSGGTADRLQGALDSLAKKCEPKRAPLDWNTTTRHDTFGPDFIVTKGEVPTAPLHTSPTTDSAYPAIAGLLRG